MKNNKKGFAPIIIALIIAVVLGGGYLIYKNTKNDQGKLISGLTPVVDPIVGQPCSGGVMGGGIWTNNGPLPAGYVCDLTGVEKGGEGKLVKTDWKTYTNTQYGFSIQYPTGTQIDLSDTSSKKVGFQPITTKGDLSIEVMQPALNCYDGITSGISPVSKMINGINFIEFSLSKEFSVGDTSATAREYCAVHSGIEYKIFSKLPYKAGTTPLDVDKDAVLNQMLSTFKLITPSTTLTNEQKVLVTAREVLGALAARDYQKLEGLVSSDGLSLNQEPRFDSTKNLIAKNDMSEIPKDTKIYLWGYTDGKGDPINLTRGQFLTTYIYSNSVDYLKAPDVAVNKTLGGGNSINTIDKDINGRTYVAFHFSGFDPKYGGMDWTTLYLVFDSVNGEYRLRGIAKDNWTI